jgi:hypothetical protein
MQVAERARSLKQAPALALLIVAQWAVAATFADDLDARTLLALPLLAAQVAAIYAIGALLGGRALALWASAWWVVLPLLSQALFVAMYRSTWRDVVLPEVLALGDLRRFCTMLALTVAALFFLRALASRGRLDVLAVAVAIGAALALGGLPDLGSLDRDALNRHFISFREYTWSARVFEFVPLAGVIAVARRSPAFAVLLALWLGAFFAVVGSRPDVAVVDGSFWTALLPAWPAYFLLGASLPLLVPRVGGVLISRARRPRFQ